MKATPTQYEDSIRAALRAGDFDAIDVLLRLYVSHHPREAIDLYDSLRVAVLIARGRP